MNNTSSVAIAVALETADRLNCHELIDRYDPDRTTTAEMQEYARCIYVIHPRQMTEVESTILSLLFISAVIGFVGGVWLDRRSDLAEAIITGIAGFCVAPVFVAFVGITAFGIWSMLS